MPVEFTIQGLEDLRLALQKLPTELASEAAIQIGISTTRAKARIAAAYPLVYRSTQARSSSASPPGELQRKLASKVTRDGVSVVGEVKNTAKIGYIFENGSAIRYTDKGAKRGVMPAGHVFIPIVAQERRAMYEALKAIIAKAGLEVSGDAQ
jgi:hypothetical protein